MVRVVLLFHVNNLYDSDAYLGCLFGFLVKVESDNQMPGWNSRHVNNESYFLLPGVIDLFV